MSAFGGSQERPGVHIGSVAAAAQGLIAARGWIRPPAVNWLRSRGGSWRTSCASLAERIPPSKLSFARFHGTHSCLRWSLCRPIRIALS
jgi:hypothetical protein